MTDDITSLTIQSLLMTVKRQREIIEKHLKEEKASSKLKNGASCSSIQCESDTVVQYSE